jgi:Leucine-rich repeat (LRR) protein
MNNFENELLEWSLNGEPDEKRLKAEYIIRSLYDKKFVGAPFKLDLRGLGLKSLPECIAALPHIKTVDLSDNALTSLPYSFATLVDVEELDLSSNNFEAVPWQLRNMRALKSLGLSDNRIESIGDEFTRCESLCWLLLNNCGISRIDDDAFSTLGNLTRLDLAYNNIVDLPTRTTGLYKLEYLRLNNNKIERMPDNYANLQSLLVMSLHNNPIDNLDHWFKDPPPRLRDVTLGNSLGNAYADYIVRMRQAGKPVHEYLTYNGGRYVSCSA